MLSFQHTAKTMQSISTCFNGCGQQLIAILGILAAFCGVHAITNGSGCWVLYILLSSVQDEIPTSNSRLWL